jgi:hypothetical protein
MEAVVDWFKAPPHDLLDITEKNHDKLQVRLVCPRLDTATPEQETRAAEAEPRPSVKRIV